MGNIDPSDWRLQGQETYLQGKVFHWQKYQAPRPSWDHEHCDFCFQKFLEQAHEGILNEGYTTEDEYYWICPACFADFREHFGWSLA